MCGEQVRFSGLMFATCSEHTFFLVVFAMCDEQVDRFSRLMFAVCSEFVGFFQLTFVMCGKHVCLSQSMFAVL